MRLEAAIAILPVLALLGACAQPRYAAAPPPVTGAVQLPPGAPSPDLSGSSVAPVAHGRLTESEIAALLSDKTVAGADRDGRPYQAFLAPDGQFRMRQDGRVAVGTWWVTADGRLCSRLAGASGDNCNAVSRQGNTVWYYRADGTVGNATVLPGNPMGL